MPVEFVIYSPRAAAELGRLERDCAALQAAWLERHPDEDAIDVRLGGRVLAAEDVPALVPADRRRGGARNPALLLLQDRVATVNASLIVRAPGHEVTPLLVSVLRLLLEHGGAGVVLRDDVLYTCEDLLRELSSKRGAVGFGDGAAATKPVDKPRSMGAAVALAVRRLVDEGALVLVEEADVVSLAERLLGHIETADAPDIGRAMSEWLLDQDEVEELFVTDARLIEEIRRSMA